MKINEKMPGMAAHVLKTFPLRNRKSSIFIFNFQLLEESPK